MLALSTVAAACSDVQEMAVLRRMLEERTEEIQRPAETCQKIKDKPVISTKICEINAEATLNRAAYSMAFDGHEQFERHDLPFM